MQEVLVHRRQLQLQRGVEMLDDLGIALHGPVPFRLVRDVSRRYAQAPDRQAIRLNFLRF
jgi:hypothetical protein